MIAFLRSATVLLVLAIWLLAPGTDCNAATIEDGNATGADESDLIGMSFTGTAISDSQATLTAGSTIAFVFDVTVN